MLRIVILFSFLSLVIVTPSYAQLPAGCPPVCTGTDAHGNAYDPRNYSNSNDPAVQGGNYVYGVPYGGGGSLPNGSGATMGITGSVIGNIFNGLGFFGGGAELPVRDETTRRETAMTAIKTTAMLVDMLLQALRGHAPTNTSTGTIIQEQAQIGQEESILYHNYTPFKWDDTFRVDAIYEHGDWMEEEQYRNQARMKTQEDLLQMLQIRQQQFGADDARISEIGDAIDACEGRNCLLQTAAKAQLEAAAQSLQTQQLLMEVANAQAVTTGGEVNEITQRAAQERAFLKNFDRPIPTPVFQDWGL